MALPRAATSSAEEAIGNETNLNFGDESGGKQIKCENRFGLFRQS